MCEKCYVDKNGITSVKCSSCGNSEKISTTIFTSKKQVYKIKCICGTVFPISLDFRQSYRKEVDLSASFCKLDDETKLQLVKSNKPINCRLSNISMTGAGITIIGRHSFKINDELFLSFTLDDQRCSVVEKICKVVIIDDKYIGVSFNDTKTLEKQLGFYLLKFK